MNIHIDDVPINLSQQNKSLGLIIDENLSWNAHIHEIFKKKYPLVSVLLSRSGHFFQCTLQLKYTKVLSSNTSIIAALYEMYVFPTTPNYYFRNAKKKLTLPKPRTDYLKRSFS